VDDGLADHVPHVYRLALRLTRDVHRAEDLTQETFLRAWQRCLQLKDKRAARVWLFRIAVNLLNDEYRLTHSSRASAVSLPDDITGAGSPPDRAAESNEELVQALKLLDALPARQRAVLHLIAVEELSLDEVCEILEINKNAAKVNLSLARKRMREILAARTSARE
jgi:RNA polymerase sigma-70 factor, ECF subfamily